MTERTRDARSCRILLIDDDPDVRQVLSAGLEQAGHTVVGAATRAEGLDRLDDSIDMALVDLRLPDGDGIELTGELKAHAPEGDFFPVILITGVEEREARVRGFRSGCDDFLNKPVNLYELRARIHNLVTRREQHAELTVANEKLRAAQERKQLLASLVVHDLRNPLSALQGNIELLVEALGDEGQDDPEMVPDILHDCRDLVAKSLSMVGGLLDVEELEEGLLVAKLAPTNVAQMCRHSARHHGASLRLRSLQLEIRIDEGLEAELDPDLMGRLVENLLDNAVRYAPRKGRVVVAADRVGDQLFIRVGNNGPPVADTEKERIFGRYYRLEARRSGARANRGLGLYFCKLVAEAHGGSIGLEQTDELPATFVVTVPA